MQDLPRAQVLRCFAEESFQPPLPAMGLRWDADASGVAERVWHLPDGLCVRGPAPDRFGVAIQRCGEDSYQVRVLWNGLCLSWERLRRVQIMASSLALILAALGTDLWTLLTQPVPSKPVPARVA
jgi:hypothetical protein